jgi:hypothetical protein
VIPMVATIAIRTAEGRAHRIWLPLPLFLVWLVLLPFVVVLLPVFVVVCQVNGVNPLRALSVAWQLLAGLRATRVEVAHASTAIRIHVL